MKQKINWKIEALEKPKDLGVPALRRCLRISNSFNTDSISVGSCVFESLFSSIHRKRHLFCFDRDSRQINYTKRRGIFSCLKSLEKNLLQELQALAVFIFYDAWRFTF